MKTKIIILLVLLVSCTNKEHKTHYLTLRLHYQLLISSADFVISDQQGVLSEGLVTLLDKDTPTFRKATHDDEMNAIDISGNMEMLKISMGTIIEQYKIIEQLYSKKNIFNGGKRQQEIDLRIGLINSAESSMLKVTGGLKPKEYIDKFLPERLKKLTK